MEIKEFSEKVKKALEEYYGGDKKIEIREIRKINGIIRTGICVTDPDKNITPTLYIEDHLKLYNEGVPFGRLIAEMIKAIDSDKLGGGFNTESFVYWEEARKRIAYRLINMQKNTELLKEVPYIRFLDMAVVFYYLLGDEEFGNASILIYNKHMECWNVTTEDLYDQAKENTCRLLPAGIESLSQLMKNVLKANIRKKAEESGLCRDDESIEDIADSMMEQMTGGGDTSPLFVLTNNINYYGAACLLYEGVLKEFADTLETDLYILPSSVHEIILLPDLGYEDAGFLKTMVSEVNDTQLSPDEVLSDTIYHYDRNTEDVRIVSISGMEETA
ncbi:MAG: hypothetical protein IKR23_02855 [Lachnospiraceae bacterium]|nr:hypothetical protein [Lachnospiraceae bacterium]